MYVSAILVALLQMVGGGTDHPADEHARAFFFLAVLTGTILFAAVQGVVWVAAEGGGDGGGGEGGGGRRRRRHDGRRRVAKWAPTVRHRGGRGRRRLLEVARAAATAEAGARGRRTHGDGFRLASAGAMAAGGVRG